MPFAVHPLLPSVLGFCTPKAHLHADCGAVCLVLYIRGRTMWLPPCLL